MFLGHFGVGFGAKPAAPRRSLGLFFLAAQWADLLWPVLLLAGWEVVEIEPGATRLTPLAFVHYPISHSLVAELVWGVLLGLTVLAATRDRSGAVVCALLVPSHWLLDVLVHRPDLPLTLRGEARVGLGLWNVPSAALTLELGFLAAGLALYLRATRPLDRTGRWGPWALAGFLVAVYAANVLGPPPPSVPAIAWAGQAQWLLVLFGWWVDRHRAPRALG
ncbi:MAG: hypothetical protein R2991_03115 [Thermoanaerobaculia bacterium]